MDIIAEAEDPEHEGDQLGDDSPGVLTDLQPAAQLEQVCDDYSGEAVQVFRPLLTVLRAPLKKKKI